MNPPRLPPIADGRAVAYETSTKKCLVHLGGWNLVRNAPEQSLHEMDLTTRVWTEVKDIPMGARSGHIMNFSKATGTVLIHGGCGSSSSSSGPSCLRDLWSLQWTTESNHVIGWVWKCLDDGTLLCRDAPTPCARCGHSGAVAEDRMYLFGGFDGSQRLNDLWSWDITENTSAVPTESSTASNRGWKNLRCTGTLPSPRDDTALCAVPNSTTGSPTLVLHGGFTEFGPSGELYLWYAETGIWTQVTAFQSGLAPGSIYKHTLIAIPPLTRDNISTPNPAPTGGSKPGNAPPPASSDPGHCGPSISTPSPPNIWLLGGRPSEHGTSPCSRPLSVTERTTIPMYSLASFRWSNLNVDGDALRIFVNGCVVFVEQDRRIWVLGGYDPEDFDPLYIPSIREIEVERVPETIVAKGAKK